MLPAIMKKLPLKTVSWFPMYASHVCHQALLENVALVERTGSAVSGHGFRALNVSELRLIITREGLN